MVALHPANDFGAQGVGRTKEIAEFCKANFGVSFPMFETQKCRSQAPAIPGLIAKNRQGTAMELPQIPDRPQVVA